MCGRYRRTTSEEELARLYIPIPKQTYLAISTPSRQVRRFSIALIENEPAMLT